VNDQPFYVGNNHRSKVLFRYAKNGYLPALESPEEKQIDFSQSFGTVLNEINERIHRNIVLMNDLQNRLNNHIDASKRKRDSL